ncbi:MAG: hypothetical protein IJS47_01725 [Clostridia bacterium]|nr:hypothetical protein [Clostridia bacterium]
MKYDSKAFGAHCGFLATMANVPWKVAFVAGYIPNHSTAIRVLEGIREIKDTITDNEAKGLSNNNPNIRQNTVKRIIGEYIWGKINHSPRNCNIIADYFLGKIE